MARQTAAIKVLLDAGANPNLHVKSGAGISMFDGNVNAVVDLWPSSFLLKEYDRLYKRATLPQLSSPRCTLSAWDLNCVSSLRASTMA